MDLTNRDLADLCYLTGLNQLNLSENKEITDISVLKSLKKLTHLNIDKTGVSDISVLKNMEHLYVLQAEYCNISDISALTGQTEITWVIMSGNPLLDISPLKNHQKLVGVKFEYCPIKDLSPLSGLKSLKDIWMKGVKVHDVTTKAETVPDSLSLYSLSASGITESSVRLDARCSYTGTRPSKVGVLLSANGGSFCEAGSDYINHSKNPFDIWYSDIGGLSPNTSYSYKFYAIVNGRTIESDIGSFTTAAAQVDASRDGAYTAYVSGTDGSLVINSKASKGYGIAEITECAACTVYPNKSSGSWLYLNYNGVEGYSYYAYLKTSAPSYSIGMIHDTDGSLCINRTASTSYCIATIPEGAQCRVFTSRKSGKWVWVEYNGVYGYAYSTYIWY